MSDEDIRMEILNIVGAVRDYPHDLNAMADARATLNVTEQIEYVLRLNEVVQRNKPVLDGLRQWDNINANANQHAEAFLRVKSLWKEAEGA